MQYILTYDMYFIKAISTIANTLYSLYVICILSGYSLNMHWNIVWYCVARVYAPQLCEVATTSWQKTQFDSTHQLVSLPQKLTKDHSLQMPSNCWWALGVTVFLSAKDLAVLNTGAKVRTISDANTMISEHQNQGQITLKMTKEMIALFKFTSNQNNDAGQGTTSCASVPWCSN